MDYPYLNIVIIAEYSNERYVDRMMNWTYTQDCITSELLYLYKIFYPTKVFVTCWRVLILGKFILGYFRKVLIKIWSSISVHLSYKNQQKSSQKSGYISICMPWFSARNFVYQYILIHNKRLIIYPASPFFPKGKIYPLSVHKFCQIKFRLQV